MIPDVRVMFEVDGAEYKLTYHDLPFATWSDLKRQAGFTPKTLLDAMSDVDVEALVALLWLARRQARPSLSFYEVMQKMSPSVQFRLLELSVEGRDVVARDDDERFIRGEPEGEPEDPLPLGGAAKS